MPQRHWVIAFNNKTDECKILELFEEWLPFKYIEDIDIRPDWQSLGIYESQQCAFQAFLGFSEQRINSSNL